MRSPGAPVAAAPAVASDQDARDEFAETLQDAFVDDKANARIKAEATTLRIRWDMCSKQMLHRLLREEKNYQTLNIREQSGLTLARLRTLGFRKVVCDDVVNKSSSTDSL